MRGAVGHQNHFLKHLPSKGWSTTALEGPHTDTHTQQGVCLPGACLQTLVKLPPCPGHLQVTQDSHDPAEGFSLSPSLCVACHRCWKKTSMSVSSLSAVSLASPEPPAYSTCNTGKHTGAGREAMSIAPGNGTPSWGWGTDSNSSDTSALQGGCLPCPRAPHPLQHHCGLQWGTPG